MSSVEQSDKVKYLQKLRDDWPEMYGEKGYYPNLINELLAEIPEATSLLGTNKPLNKTLRTYNLFESTQRSEWNNNDESVRPKNTFGKPTPKQKNKRSQAAKHPLTSLFEDSYTKFFNIPGDTETAGDDLAFHHIRLTLAFHRSGRYQM